MLHLRKEWVLEYKNFNSQELIINIQFLLTDQILKTSGDKTKQIKRLLDIVCVKSDGIAEFSTLVSLSKDTMFRPQFLFSSVKVFGFLFCFLKI